MTPKRIDSIIGVYYTHGLEGDEMSKGSRVISIRPGDARLSAMRSYVEAYNLREVLRPPIDLTEFVRRAIDEKLDKVERGRRSKQKAKIRKAENRPVGDNENVRCNATIPGLLAD